MKKAVHLVKKNLIPTFSPSMRRAFFIAGILLFVLFVLYTLAVRHDLLRSWDFNMTVKLQDRIPLRFDSFFSFLSVFGRFETSLIILSIILAIRRKILGFFIIGLFGFGHVIEIIGKSLLEQPGPPHMFLRTTEMASEFPGLYIHTGASYPSGHSMRAIYLCIIIILILYNSKKLSAYVKFPIIGLVVLYAFLMLLSRVSLGEHWTTDIIGGGLLGASFAFFALLFL